MTTVFWTEVFARLETPIAGVEDSREPLAGYYGAELLTGGQRQTVESG